jgi:hypothetical protein
VLVSASLDEGYGLPVAEALEWGSGRRHRHADLP